MCSELLCAHCLLGLAPKPGCCHGTRTGPHNHVAGGPSTMHPCGCMPSTSRHQPVVVAAGGRCDGWLLLTPPSTTGTTTCCREHPWKHGCRSTCQWQAHPSPSRHTTCSPGSLCCPPAGAGAAHAGAAHVHVHSPLVDSHPPPSRLHPPPSNFIPPSQQGRVMPVMGSYR